MVILVKINATKRKWDTIRELIGEEDDLIILKDVAKYIN